MLGRVFTEYASKMKLDMAYKKAEKEMNKVKRYKMPKEKNREKIYERNPNTGVIRWRYIDESPDKFGK